MDKTHIMKHFLLLITILIIIKPSENTIQNKQPLITGSHINLWGQSRFGAQL